MLQIKKIYKHLRFFLPIAAVMVVVPALIRFLPSDAFMGAAVLLFLLVDPLFSLGAGIAAGWDIRLYWYVPLLNALLYWLGACLFIAGWNLSILFYVLVYAFVGAGAMCLTCFVRYLRKKP